MYSQLRNDYQMPRSIDLQHMLQHLNQTSNSLNIHLHNRLTPATIPLPQPVFHCVDTPPPSTSSYPSPNAATEDNDRSDRLQMDPGQAEREQEQVPDQQVGNKRAARRKSKRVRTIFTPEQLKRLEQEFSNQMYLVGHDRGYLADSLGLSEAQVKVWFQNRRIKHRKLTNDK